MLGAEKLWDARLSGGEPWEACTATTFQSNNAASWERLCADAQAAGDALAEQSRRWEALILGWSDAPSSPTSATCLLEMLLCSTSLCVTWRVFFPSP